MYYDRFVRNQSARLVLALIIAALVSGLVLLGRLPNRASSAALRKGGEIAANNSISNRSPVANADPTISRRAAEAYGKLPLSFEINQGQTNEQVKFLSRGAGYSLFLTSSEAVLSLEQGRAVGSTQASKANASGRAGNDVLRMKLVGANPTPKIEGSEELPGKSNYFIGNNPKNWRTNVSTFARVHYRGVYPGVDVVYYGNQRKLENDFVVAPGTNPGVITLAYDGAKKISVDTDGSLVLGLASEARGDVRLQKPAIYQLVDGVRHEIAGNYVLKNLGSVGFEVAAYDHTRPLVIDPVLIYSFPLVGNSTDGAAAIAVDAAGNAYIGGFTRSPNFPTASAMDSVIGGLQDVFISKINAAGSALVYSTFLGGSLDDSGYDLAIDAAGNAYVTGRTSSTDFPTVNAFDSTYSGGTVEDGFVARLNSAGSALVYSTYLSGQFGARPYGIATDGAGNAYVTGTTSVNHPVTAATAFEATNFNSGFLSKLNTNGSGASSLVYSTFLGHNGSGEGRAIAADATGNVYITGNLGATATSFATAGAFQTTYGGGSQDAYVEKFNTNLSGAASRVYATYLGGSGNDFGGASAQNFGKAIAIDASGNAYLTGETTSTNFPTLNPFQPANGGATDAFLTKLNAAGSALIYSTYLGGSGTQPDEGSGVAVNVVGNAYVTGSTNSANFPNTPAPVLSTTGAAFVTKFTPSGGLVYSTRLSGNFGIGVALDGAGNAFVTGTSGSDVLLNEVADPTIIGRVVDEDNNPIAGATVNLTGVPSATTSTDANGFFTFGLLTVANTYTVAVVVPNYIFNSQTVSNLQKNVRLDFSPVVVSIGGQVTLGAGGLSATTMTLSGGKSLSTATDGGGNYSFANLPAGRNYTVTPAKPSFGFEPTSRSFTNTLVNQTANFVASATIQFNVGSYTATETAGKATITITRTSGASGPASVRYGISDGTALQKSDYIMAFGTLNLAAGETSKSFDVLIVDDAYVEGDEFFFVTLSDAVGATLGTPNPAMVTITDNDTVPTTVNPIDQTRFFVQMGYYDFLSRYPDQPGWDFWTNNINNCAPQPSCIESQRINTSAAFFLSIEFQQTGYLVEKIYKASYGDASGTSTIGGTHQLPVPVVRFTEFLSDAEEIGQGLVVGQAGWETVLENNKQAFASEFVQRSRFTTALPTTMTPAQFVDSLNQNAGNVLSASERASAINLFGGAGNSSNATARALALRQVADDPDLTSGEFNHAFVLMQYIGYLRRSPNDAPDSDYSGYDFWLTKLNQFGGNYINAEMVKAFLSSDEYRKRFAPSPGSSPPPGLTPEQRLAALEAVRAKFEALKNGANPSAVNQEMLNFILSRPEFTAAGISTDSCVWAKYTDGVGLIVVNNRDPDPLGSPSPAPKPAVAQSVSANARPENLPESPKAHLYFALGPLFRNPVPDIGNWLIDENYAPINEAATVENLRHVGGEGVFYFDGHGGSTETDSGNAYVLVTAERPTVERDFQLTADLIPNPPASGLSKNRVVYVAAVDDVKDGKDLIGSYYGITSQFVRDYWGKFSPGSLVFIDSCSSASKGASGLKDAIKEKGASVYAGWTDTVHGTVAFEATRFVFDRLLGANKIYPESDGFQQRPFDYLSVSVDLPLHQLGHDPDSGADLAFTPFPTNGNSQTLLAPSIWFMEVDSYFNLLTIQGEFGDDPGTSSRTVTVGGRPCHVITWANNQILCDLPVSGPGSSGEVIVTVRQQKSNAASLTEWEGDFTHTVTGKDTLKQTATYHIRFRADIRLVRNHIHEAPILIADRAIVATEDSGYSYELSGSFTETFPGSPPTVCTEKWSGAGSLPRLPFLQTGNGILAIGLINTTKLTFQLSVSAGSARLVNFGCTPPGGSSDTTDSLFSPKVGSNGTFSVDLDADFSIKGNTLSGTDFQGYKHTLTWNLIKPKNGTAPKPDSPR